MKISSTDPMIGNEVRDPDNALFVIKGEGESAVKIYFESNESRQEYLEFCDNAAQSPSIEAYNKIADNETHWHH